MKNPGILCICLICLYLSACDTQGLNTPVGGKAAEIKITPEITAHEKIAETEASTLEKKHPMKLSIDLPVDPQVQNENFLSAGSEPTEGSNSLFIAPQKNNANPGINLSGKVFTDDNKLENKDYLNSLDGVQINIKGSFN